MSLLSTVGKTAAEAHSLNGCGATRPIQDEMVNEFRVDAANIGAAAQAGARLTAAAWDQDTVLGVVESTSGVDLIYTRIDDRTRPGLAGRAIWPPEDQWVNCRMAGGKATINNAHFDPNLGAAPMSIQEKGCIYAHEAGHIWGLAHSNLPDHTDTNTAGHTVNTSMMRGNEHPHRCHGFFPPGAPLQADINNIAAYH